jgi:adenine-specific DNA-methyltransferase
MNNLTYLGSKIAMLTEITKAIKSLKGNIAGTLFFDAMAGSGVVGKHLKELGATVYSNDVQYYSYVLNSVYISSEGPPSDYEKRLNYLRELPGREGLIFNNYCPSVSGRMYYTDENGKKCDAIRQEIINWVTSGEITEQESYWYIASLILGMHEVSNTTGAYKAFLKNWEKSAITPLLLPVIQPVPGIVGKTFNSPIENLILDVTPDIAYLDPPYNREQYSTMYHVLETVATYKDPGCVGVTGYGSSRFSSNFSKSDRAYDAIWISLQKIKPVYLILSYSNESIIPIEELTWLLEHAGAVTVEEFSKSRYKSINREMHNGVIEYLFMVECHKLRGVE